MQLLCYSFAISIHFCVYMANGRFRRFMILLWPQLACHAGWITFVWWPLSGRLPAGSRRGLWPCALPVSGRRSSMPWLNINACRDSVNMHVHWTALWNVHCHHALNAYSMHIACMTKPSNFPLRVPQLLECLLNERAMRHCSQGGQTSCCTSLLSS